MPYDNNNHSERERDNDGLYSKRLKAGKRRTYFFDVRTTRGNDYFLTITESKKRFNDDGYDRHKIFLYKEDFNKFIDALADAVNHVKTELLPDFDFDSFSHEDYDSNAETRTEPTPVAAEIPVEDASEEKAPPAPTPAAENGSDFNEPAIDEPQEDKAPSINEQVEKW